jgi:hypothetical protein
MRRTTLLPILVSLGLVGTFGAVHGIFTDRWAPSGELRQALEVLPNVPYGIGPWVGKDQDFEIDDLNRMGIKGCVMRQYKNNLTGEAVSLLIVCGRGGPICVHTPDVCYANAGYREISNETLEEINEGDRKSSFITARFGKPDGIVPTRLEIFWTWSRDGDDWQAPRNPRLSLARAPALYKMYVVREYLPGTSSDTATTSRNFLTLALPAIRQKLPR